MLRRSIRRRPLPAGVSARETVGCTQACPGAIADRRSKASVVAVTAAVLSKGAAVSLLLWIILATLYLVLLWTLGIRTFTNGHYVLFFVGIVFPIAWIVGTLIAPAADAAAAEARSSVQ
jgi:hypothetical protein